MDKKKCSVCNKVKNISEFSFDKRSSDGLKSECRECHKLQTQNSSLKNKPASQLISKIKSINNISNVEIAKELNVGVNSIYVWEKNDRTPSAKNFTKLTELFKSETRKYNTQQAENQEDTASCIKATEIKKSFRDARIEARLSIKDVADMLNIHETMVQKYETGIRKMPASKEKQLKIILEFTQVKNEIEKRRIETTQEVKIITNEKGERFVDLKELYKTLEIKRDFTSWHIHNVINNEFIAEGIDYFKQFDIDKKEHQFILTLNTAKKLAMQTKTVKGEEVRNYFIKMEEVAKQAVVQYRPSYEIEDKKQRALAWIEEEEVREKLALENDINKPKVLYHDEVLNCSDSFSITEIAKGLGTTAFQLNKYLCSQKIQFKRGEKYFLYSKYDNRGYTNVKTIEIEKNDGTKTFVNQTQWTNKGKKFIINLFTSKYDDLLPQLPL